MMSRPSCVSWFAVALVGCSGLVGPDQSRLDPANAPGDAGRDLGRRDSGNPDGGGPDGGDPDGGGPDGGDGECLGNADCNDGVACTTDTCVGGFCQFNPDDTQCAGDDPNPCVARVFCDRTMGCQGVALSCDDGVSCTDDRCEIAAGGCVYSNRCPDGDTCDPVLGCFGGECDGDSDCDDDDECTQDRCVEGVCQRPALVCPGGDDPCQTSACDPDSGDCVSIALPNGTPCPDDGNLCTTGEACLDGRCQARGAIACGDPGTGVCMTPICDPATGTCAASPAPAGTPCNDGNPCTDGTTCDGMGACGGGVTCPDDGNPCTDQHCTPTGCAIENAPSGGTCALSTGVAGTCCVGNCTNTSMDSDNCGSCGADCGDALCIGGFCAECERDTDCPTTAACVQPHCRSGMCTVDIADGFCFIGGACVAAGTPNPSNQCQGCAPTTNATGWTNREGGCDDGLFCTVNDRCILSTGAARCAGEPRNCRDGNTCTGDFCNEDADRCENPNRICTACCGTTGLGSCCATPPGMTAMCTFAPCGTPGP